MVEPEPTVRYETDGPIAVLTLSAPPANCASHRLMTALDAAILKARFDDEVEVIVLTGEGSRFFCAGSDIAVLASVTERYAYYYNLHVHETLARLENTPKLVVAALNGHAVGGGLEIALAADLRVARKGAGTWGLPEVKLGLLPGYGGTQRLPRLVGRQKALRWMLEGHTGSFEEAFAEGVVDRVIDCPAEDFLAEVKAWVRAYTAPSAASGAVGHIKRAVQASALPLEGGLAVERELQARLFAADDAREGLDAYVEKRSPRFQGS